MQISVKLQKKEHTIKKTSESENEIEKKITLFISLNFTMRSPWVGLKWQSVFSYGHAKKLCIDFDQTKFIQISKTLFLFLRDVFTFTTSGAIEKKTTTTKSSVHSSTVVRVPPKNFAHICWIFRWFHARKEYTLVFK